MSRQSIISRNEKLGPRVVKALKSRHFEAFYCTTSEEALALAISLIPQDHVVAWGGSATTAKIGLIQAVKENYHVINRDEAESADEKMTLMRQSLLADTYITGTNAISENGVLVNVDGIGNRVAAMIYGPKNVVVVAGMNKVVRSVEDAVVRARTIAAPTNAQRFPDLSTPCLVSGSCENCKSLDSICSYISVIRLCRPAGKIKVILIGENLGY